MLATEPRTGILIKLGTAVLLSLDAKIRRNAPDFWLPGYVHSRLVLIKYPQLLLANPPYQFSPR